MELSVINVNKQKEKQFNKKGIYTVEDLLKFVPRKYFDYSNPKNIKDLIAGDNVSVVGTVLNVKTNNEKKYVSINIEDSNGDTMEIIWFRAVYVSRMLVIGQKYIFCGPVNENKFNYKPQMINPLFSYDIDKYKRIFPVYSKIQGMSDDYLKRKD
jgi:ATP-dependent DNA helicase RecG